MKQFLQKSMATRLVGLVVAFFMMVAANGAAQDQSGGSDASGANSVSKTISQLSADLKQPSVVKKTGEPRPQLRSGGNVVKIGMTEYSDWETAVAALQENEEIVLLKDLELDATTATIPAVACTISGEQGTEVLSYKEVGECKTLLMKASLTFKNIILDMDGIMAGGYPLVLDEGTDVSDAMKAASFRIWGGALNEDVATTSITVKAGTYDYIYGGSSNYAVDGKATVDIQGGTINWVFGGGARAGSTVGETAVTFSGGTITQVISGGGMRGDVENDTRLIIKGDASALIAHGGGYSGKVNGTSYTTIEETAAITGNFYGGGSEASAVCGNTEVTVNSGTIGQVDQLRYHLMGGGDEAPVTGKAKVTINGGTFNCFVTAGGGQYNDATTATCGSTELNITGGIFNKWTYGGGWTSPVLGTAMVKISGTPTFYNTIFGGGRSATATCGSTDVQASSGSLPYLYGGGEFAPVIGESKLTIDGTASITSVFGGCYDATCRGTHVEISGGTHGFINGGGYQGNVTGECYLNISGNPTIMGNVFGGSNQEGTTVGSTRVEISGGIFRTENNSGPGSIYAGGWGCVVTGNTSIVATGGEMGNIFGGCGQGEVEGNASLVINGANIKAELKGSTYTGGSVRGGGSGEWGVDNDKGKVGSTTVEVIKLGAGSTDNLDIFGGGLFANVAGSTNVTVKDGKFFAIYGTGNIDSNNSTTVGGDVNVTISGGTIEHIRVIRAGDSEGKIPVAGSLNLTIEGGTVTSVIGSGFDAFKNNAEYKDCRLTIRNLGNEQAPYSLPNVSGINTVILDNSVVNMMAKPVSQYSGWQVKNGSPLIIEGNGRLVGDNIQLAKFGPDDFTENEPLVIADNLPEGTTFVAFKAPDITTPIYKAGNTYRPAGNNADKLKVITITSASNHGKPSVVWKEPTRNTKLDSGDKVPADTELTLSVVPSAGYQGGTIYVDGQPLSGSTYTVTDDVTFSADGFIRIPDPDPTPTVYYNITIPTVEGVTTDPTPGNYEVEAWGSFRFFLTLDKEYDKSEPVVTTDRSETITPDSSNGAYIVKYVRSDVEIFIDGIVKNPDPVANTEIQSGTKAWVNDHRLFIRTDKPEDVLIYTFGGEQKKAFRSKGGDEVVSLEAGRYIVCVGDKRFKVIF